MQLFLKNVLIFLNSWYILKSERKKNNFIDLEYMFKEIDKMQKHDKNPTSQKI